MVNNKFTIIVCFFLIPVCIVCMENIDKDIPNKMSRTDRIEWYKNAVNICKKSRYERSKFMKTITTKEASMQIIPHFKVLFDEQRTDVDQKKKDLLDSFCQKHALNRFRWNLCMKFVDEGMRMDTKRTYHMLVNNKSDEGFPCLLKQMIENNLRALGINCKSVSFHCQEGLGDDVYCAQSALYVQHGKGHVISKQGRVVINSTYFTDKTFDVQDHWGAFIAAKIFSKSTILKHFIEEHWHGLSSQPYSQEVISDLLFEWENRIGILYAALASKPLANLLCIHFLAHPNKKFSLADFKQLSKIEQLFLWREALSRYDVS